MPDNAAAMPFDASESGTGSAAPGSVAESGPGAALNSAAGSVHEPAPGSVPDSAPDSAPGAALTITIEDGLDHLGAMHDLIVEYASRLNRDLGFQHLDEELADLPHKYAGENGRMLAAVVDGEVAGCVAYHRLNERQAEMKRLYVSPRYRGLHLGQKLGAAIVAAAADDGYAQMVLDTAEPLTHAIAIYHGLGFREIAAYYYNPMPDVIYMGRNL